MSNTAWKKYLLIKKKVCINTPKLFWAVFSFSLEFFIQFHLIVEFQTAQTFSTVASLVCIIQFIKINQKALHERWQDYSTALLAEFFFTLAGHKMWSGSCSQFNVYQRCDFSVKMVNKWYGAEPLHINPCRIHPPRQWHTQSFVIPAALRTVPTECKGPLSELELYGKRRTQRGLSASQRETEFFFSTSGWTHSTSDSQRRKQLWRSLKYIINGYTKISFSEVLMTNQFSQHRDKLKV